MLFVLGGSVPPSPLRFLAQEAGTTEENTMFDSDAAPGVCGFQEEAKGKPHSFDSDSPVNQVFGIRGNDGTLSVVSENCVPEPCPVRQSVKGVRPEGYRSLLFGGVFCLRLGNLFLALSQGNQKDDHYFSGSFAGIFGLELPGYEFPTQQQEVMNFWHSVEKTRVLTWRFD